MEQDGYIVFVQPGNTTAHREIDCGQKKIAALFRVHFTQVLACDWAIKEHKGQ